MSYKIFNTSTPNFQSATSIAKTLGASLDHVQQAIVGMNLPAALILEDVVFFDTKAVLEIASYLMLKGLPNVLTQQRPDLAAKAATQRDAALMENGARNPKSN